MNCGMAGHSSSACPRYTQLAWSVHPSALAHERCACAITSSGLSSFPSTTLDILPEPLYEGQLRPERYGSPSGPSAPGLTGSTRLSSCSARCSSVLDSCVARFGVSLLSENCRHFTAVSLSSLPTIFPIFARRSSSTRCRSERRASSSFARDCLTRSECSLSYHTAPCCLEEVPALGRACGCGLFPYASTTSLPFAGVSCFALRGASCLALALAAPSCLLPAAGLLLLAPSAFAAFAFLVKGGSRTDGLTFPFLVFLFERTEVSSVFAATTVPLGGGIASAIVPELKPAP
mmetsp:Transcript_44338/g.110255  ORF Transcript_44338/g.110255 Transcript_44338/m.110255 type:complete len:290 (+) Transcript_44338:946-1815(+)